jgi:predicted nucleic acid-binding protein
MKIIVLDTNIWLSELALMSPVGCALSHYISVSGFKIGLPEVIEIEAKHNFKTNLYEYRESVKKNYDRILAIFGQMKELILPTDEDIENKVEQIFDFHADRIIRISFEEQCARDSLRKIIAKEPPNSENNQQFKDGVIWANCLDFAKESEVVIVTKDKAFFQDKKYEKGLAANLLKEAQEAPHQVSIFHELTSLLSEIKVDFHLERERLVKVIENETYKNVIELAERREFEVKSLIKSEIEYFATTDPNEVSVKFVLKYDIENRSTEQRTDAYCESRGDFQLNIISYTMRNFVNQGEYIFWIDDKGEKRHNKNVYGYINETLGYRTIAHSVSYKLNSIN